MRPFENHLQIMIIRSAAQPPEWPPFVRGGRLRCEIQVLTLPPVAELWRALFSTFTFPFKLRRPLFRRVYSMTPCLCSFRTKGGNNFPSSFLFFSVFNKPRSLFFQASGADICFSRKSWREREREGVGESQESLDFKWSRRSGKCPLIGWGGLRVAGWARQRLHIMMVRQEGRLQDSENSDAGL